MTFKSAEQVCDREGRWYHIGLKAGEVAPYILLCGDPARVEKVVRHFKKRKRPIRHRDYCTVTGEYRGIPVSVMATGMGPDNMEIALVELAHIVEKATLIRIGSSAGLTPQIKLGDIVISSGAVRLENTTDAYVCEGYPAVPHYEVTMSLIAAAQTLGIPHHIGLTATAPGFYAPQGRQTEKLKPRHLYLHQELEAMKVSNFEMEASALFILSHLVGFRAGAVCAVYANRHANRFINRATMKKAEERCIQTGLEAVHLLAQKGPSQKESLS